MKSGWDVLRWWNDRGFFRARDAGVSTAGWCGGLWWARDTRVTAAGWSSGLWWARDTGIATAVWSWWDVGWDRFWWGSWAWDTGIFAADESAVFGAE